MTRPIICNKMVTETVLAALCWIISLASTAGGQQSGRIAPAFPGAEGFAAETPGGRGGNVMEVTNLNDRGPGSFRAACEANDARIVVFRTGGTIEVRSPIVIREPFITIAGQTAPGDGIIQRHEPWLASPIPVTIQPVEQDYELVTAFC